MSKRTDAVKSIPLFSRVPSRDLKHIVDRLRDEHFSPGQKIVTEGEPTGRMYIVTTGRAKVIVRGRTRNHLAAGALIGELSVFDRSPRSATIEAETDVTALSLSSVEFGALLEEQPSIATAVIRTLADRVRKLEKELVS